MEHALQPLIPLTPHENTHTRYPLLLHIACLTLSCVRQPIPEATIPSQYHLEGCYCIDGSSSMAGLWKLGLHVPPEPHHTSHHGCARLLWVDERDVGVVDVATQCKRG